MNKKCMFDRFILEELEAIREMTRQDSEFQRFNVALDTSTSRVWKSSSLPSWARAITE